VLFNSVHFAVFIVAVVAIKACLKERYLPSFLVVASYYFYAGWNIYYLPLLLATTALDYGICQVLAREETPGRRKGLLALSLVGNLGLLLFFKYGNFLWENIAYGLLRGAGADVPAVLAITLPVGISFYTFQSMGHTIDVYRRDFNREVSLRQFALYVSFFPQLVAGPILRGMEFFPQLDRLKERRDWWGGLDLVVTGFLKKVLIADNLALYVDAVFADTQGYSTTEITLATYAFAAQIYCDFSGYTDIARGVAKWIGIEIPINFDYPYFSQGIVDFWRRWHISLSSWLRDYLYISLGGNRGGQYRTLRNLLLTMALGGFWHGAAWNFLLWGMYHGVLLVIAHTTGWLSGPVEGEKTWRRLLRAAATFHLVLIGWFLFRVGQLGDIEALWTSKAVVVRDTGELYHMLVYLLVFICAHSLRYVTRLRMVASGRPLVLQAVVISGAVGLMVVLGARASNFIYFQF
jgi:alginate O-acetyltransferase complex protein AlgI